MSARVLIELPDSSLDDACGFGLWLKMVLQDSETRIGEIRVEAT